MAMKNLWQFQQTLNRYCEEDMPRAFMNRHINVVMFLFGSIRRRTPVAPDDSEWPGFKGGHAKANWRVSINEPPTDVIGERGRPSKLKSLNTIRGQFDQLKVQGTKSPIRPGTCTLWIFNNVHYLQALADGHSHQAAAGEMIETSWDDTVDFIRTGHATNWWD